MPKRSNLSIVLLIIDLMMVWAVFHTMAWLRGITFPQGFIFVALTLPAAFMVTAIYLIDGYKVKTDMLSLDYMSQHFIGFIFATLTTLLLTFVFIPSNFPLQTSRAVVALSFAALAPITLFYRRITSKFKAGDRSSKYVIFFGDERACDDFLAACARHGLTQKVLVTSFEPDNLSSIILARPDAISHEQLVTQINDGSIEVEAIVLRESAVGLPPDIGDDLVKFYFEGLPTYTLELFHETYWRLIPLYRLNQTWLFQAGFSMAREPVFERLKRITDVGLAGFGLLFSLPVFLPVALAIKLQDGGPIFFRQTRIGQHRVPFQLMKFRTMRVGSDKGNAYTQKNDNRITGIGKVLRATRLDEWPQLWNVLRGEMSMIGPRAEWDRLVADYEKEIPCYHFRHLVKPGITGWAQINYPYGADLQDTLRKLEYDLYYIRHFSFVLDASIVMKTIHVMLFGKGR